MKKLLIIPILFLTVLCSAQFTKSGGSFLKSGTAFLNVPPVDLYCSEYDTVLAAFGTLPHDTIKTKQNAMVYSLDSMGVWDRMAVFYVFAAHEESSESLINWITPGTYDADNVSSTTWAQWQGYTGDGASDYISTNFNPYTDSTHYGNNNGTVAIYLRTNIQEAATVYGSYGAGTIIRVAPRNTSDVCYYRINAADNSYATNTDSRGLWIATRRGHNETELYRNGSHFDNETTESAGIPNAEITILNYYPGVGNYSTHQVAIAFIMDAVSDDEASKINTIIERYMDSIGTGVQ